MKLAKKFALATALVTGITASSSALAATWSEADKSTAELGKNGVSITQILDSNFISALPNGMHKIVIDQEKLKTDSDVTCLLIKSRHPNNYLSYGYAGLSCNWPKPKAP